LDYIGGRGGVNRLSRIPPLAVQVSSGKLGYV
jgi:hypothetical protein